MGLRCSSPAALLSVGSCCRERGVLAGFYRMLREEFSSRGGPCPENMGTAGLAWSALGKGMVLSCWCRACLLNAARCRAATGPPCLQFLLPNHSEKQCRSPPCSRTAAVPGAKHLGKCFRAWIGLLGVVAGNATGALMTKNGFFLHLR